MAKIFQNPFFQVGILFILSSFIWYVTADEHKDIKRKVLSLSTDGLYYFILYTLGLNVLFNVKDILNDPFRIILFSSKISWLSALLVILYLFYKYQKKILDDELIINQIIHYFLFLGFTNHLFYYFKYQNITSVILLILYFVFYLGYQKFEFQWKNEMLFVLLALIHGLLLTVFGKVIIYYQIIFYRYQMITLFLLISILLFYFRSWIPSKQKSQV